MTGSKKQRLCGITKHIFCTSNIFILTIQTVSVGSSKIYLKNKTFTAVANIFPFHHFDSVLDENWIGLWQ